jgi:hypothetical protein
MQQFPAQRLDPAGQPDVEHEGNFSPREGLRELLQSRQLAGHVGSADQSSDRASAYDVRFNIGFS